MRADAVGNLLLHYKRGAARVARPVCLTAHLDHPGFVAEGMIGSGPAGRSVSRRERGVAAKGSHRFHLRAVWRGGVLPEFFVGSGVRFYSGGRWVRGRVLSTVVVKKGLRKVVKSATIEVAAEVEVGSPGMWDLPDPRVRNGRIYARATDDLAGAAAMLACADALDRVRPSGEAYFLFTRAEEVGFIGAIAACGLKTVPRKCLVVAVENSSELPNAKMGDGPILRVGDRASTYFSPATAFTGRVAEALAKSKRGFVFQRKLMDGGTCESSAFCALGYEATGVCVALGNYHNMNKRTSRIGPEYIDLKDFSRLTDWFYALATTKLRYTGRDENLQALLGKLQKEYGPLLRRSVPT